MTAPRPGYSGAGRALWMVWCCAWAAGWLLFADALVAVSGPWWWAVVASGGSLGAIWLPVAKGQRNPP